MSDLLLKKRSFGLTVLLGLAIAMVGSASASHAATGPLGALTATDCLTSFPIDPNCGTIGVTGLETPYPPVITSDGKNVYVPSLDQHAIVGFTRNPVTGALTPLTPCISSSANSSCTDQTAVSLGTVFDLAVSRDGKNLYSVDFESPSTVEIFTRDPDGAIHSSSCWNEDGSKGCDQAKGITGANGVVVSPDGKNVYVGSATSKAIAVFERDTDTGALTQLSAPNDCISTATPACAAGKGVLGGAMTISPDGKYLYTAGVSVFERHTGTGDKGRLTQLPGSSGCVVDDPGDDDLDPTHNCVDGIGLEGGTAVKISSDSKNLYVAAFGGNNTYGSVAVFNRNPATGTIAQPDQGACITDTDPTAEIPGCDTAPGLLTVTGLAISPDGENVYATGADTNSVGVFSRNLDSGQLTPLGDPHGCVEDSGIGSSDHCGLAPGLIYPNGIVVSPEGNSVYAVGGNGIGSTVAIFVRQVAPSCDDVAKTTAVGQPVTVPLTCTDANGDTLTVETADPPKGAVGSVDQGAVVYTPDVGFSGTDTFSFTANDGSLDSKPATATVTVTDPNQEDPSKKTDSNLSSSSQQSGSSTTGSSSTGATSGKNALPKSKVAKLKRKALAARKLKALTGTASDDQTVSAVQVAVVKLSGGAKAPKSVALAAAKAKATCAWLTKSGTFKRAKAAKQGKLCKPTAARFLKATGTAKWSLKLRKALKPGKYVVFSRAVDSAGQKERSLSQSAGNVVVLNVRKK